MANPESMNNTDKVSQFKREFKHLLHNYKFSTYSDCGQIELWDDNDKYIGSLTGEEDGYISGKELILEFGDNYTEDIPWPQVFVVANGSPVITAGTLRKFRKGNEVRTAFVKSTNATLGKNIPEEMRKNLPDDVKMLVAIELQWIPDEFSL